MKTQMDLEELEDVDDIRFYDEAKNDDDGERIFFDDYLRSRHIKNQHLPFDDKSK